VKSLIHCTAQNTMNIDWSSSLFLYYEKNIASSVKFNCFLCTVPFE
jgi:hypothetical protein